MRNKTQFLSMPKLIMAVFLIVMIGALLGSWAYFANYNPVLLTLRPTEPQQVENQVVLTTNKTEYSQKDTIKMTMKNNLEAAVQCDFVFVEKFEENKWATVYSFCPYSGRKCDPEIIPSGSAKEFRWNQELSFSIYSASEGSYRFMADCQAMWLDPPIAALFYSNEFTIGEVKEGVSITTDEAEYEKGKEVKLVIQNNLNEDITFGIISLEVDSGKMMELFGVDGDSMRAPVFDELIKDIYCLCDAKCNKLPSSVKANSSEEYVWNQKTGLCGELPIGKNLRFKISLWKDPSNVARVYYSNEFTIGETRFNCDKSKEEINKLLENIKYCESDKDCFIDGSIDLICPFGCYLLRSDIYPQDKPLLSIIKNKISEYGIECPSCLYECPYIPEQKNIKCQNNKCVDIRLAKPNEETPSLLRDEKNLAVDDWDCDPGQNCHGLISPEQCDDFDWPISYGCRTANKYACYSYLAERNKNSAICENMESMAFENETVKNFSKDQCYWRAVLGLNKAGMNDKIDFCDKFTNEIIKNECLKMANKSSSGIIKQITNSDKNKNKASVIYFLPRLIILSFVIIVIIILLIFLLLTKNTNSIKERGGMQIGWQYGTFPFAELTANRDKLAMNTFFSGNYSFSPKQVVSIKKQPLPFSLGTGVQIKHIVSDYPESIMFKSFDNDKLIRNILAVGFIPKANPADAPRISGSAFRWQTLLAGAIFWNILLLTDIITNKFEPGLFSFIALLLIFIISALTPKSRFLQSIVLKPGRNHGEIRHCLLFSSFLSGIMSFFFLIGLMLKNFNQ